MLLSILIPSLASRSGFLARLLAVLSPQVTEDVQVLIDVDNGAVTVGEKRNRLVQSAVGDYTAFVDDDDLVSEDYIQQLLTGCRLGVDCVSIRGEVTKNGAPLGQFIDEPYTRSQTVRHEGRQTYLRGFQHLDAIKREIALSVEFEHRSYAEDSRWAKRISETRKVQTWHMVPTPVYHYFWRYPKVV